MNLVDLMLVGNCCVCGDMVDHSEMERCETCLEVFHWPLCGDWDNGKYTCDNCKEYNNAKVWQ